MTIVLVDAAAAKVQLRLAPDDDSENADLEQLAADLQGLYEIHIARFVDPADIPPDSGIEPLSAAECSAMRLAVLTGLSARYDDREAGDAFSPQVLSILRPLINLAR